MNGFSNSTMMCSVGETRKPFKSPSSKRCWPGHAGTMRRVANRETNVDFMLPLWSQEYHTGEGDAGNSAQRRQHGVGHGVVHLHQRDGFGAAARPDAAR